MESIKSALKYNIENGPKQLAVKYKNQSMSYEDLGNALELTKHNVGPVNGARIMLILPDSLASYLWHLYLFINGAISIPLSVQWPTGKIEDILQRTSPHLVVTNEILFKKHLKIFKKRPCIILNSVQQELQCISEFDKNNSSDIAQLISTNSKKQIQDTRLIVFTSGTTGKPKGVCLSQGNLIAAANMMVSFLSLDSSRKSLVTVPLYDYYGFIQIYGHILGNCGFLFGDNTAFPGRIMQRIIEEDITDLVLVPYTVSQIIKLKKEQKKSGIRRLKFITSSSDVLSPNILNEVFAINPKVRVYNIYGLTEAGRACYKVISSKTQPSLSIGVASKGVEISIDGRDGGSGEIVIKGPNVMQGYLEDIIENTISFKPCNQIYTGDLGYFDEKGEIILIGRKDDIINIKGFKIHPNEIELTALQVPDVIDAIAKKSAPDSSGDTIQLDVVLSNDKKSIEQLRSHLFHNLERVFVPSKINVVSELKRTELGYKLIRK